MLSPAELQLGEEYKSGIEDGLQHGLLNMNNSPMACPEGTSESYRQGFQQGVQAAFRALSKKDKVELPEVEVGSEASSGEENSIEEEEEVEEPKTCFMEEEDGVPEDCMNPIEANSLESSLLNDGVYKITRKHYYRNGYAVYIKWLCDKLHNASLHKEWDRYIYFSVARHINEFFEGRNPMGEDLEILYLINKFRKKDPNSDPVLLASTVFKYIQNSNLQDFKYEDIYGLVDKYPSISLENFYDRLRKLSEDDLDKHSSVVWRGTKAVLSNEPLTLSIDKLEEGSGFAPSCGFNLGIRMLEKSGFIPRSMQDDVKTPCKETRTLEIE